MQVHFSRMFFVTLPSDRAQELEVIETLVNVVLGQRGALRARAATGRRPR
jgi:hypothetical protein